MIRTVVATYLMVMAVVGPLACCCSASRLTAQFFSPARSETGPARTNASSCCRHHAPASDEEPLTDLPDRPATPDCPCKQGKTCEVAALPALVDGSAEVSSRLTAGEWLLASAVTTHASFLALEAAASGGGQPPGLPFLSTHDLLCVHRILRC